MCVSVNLCCCVSSTSFEEFCCPQIVSFIINIFCGKIICLDYMFGLYNPEYSSSDQRVQYRTHTSPFCVCHIKVLSELNLVLFVPKTWWWWKW
jgi:hypothetical protein